MSLIYCPECGHEISTAAVACPSCGRPLKTKPAAAVTPVVVERQPRTDSIPPWVIAPIVLLGVIVLFGLIYLFTSGDDANSNLSVNVNARRAENSRLPDRASTTTDSTSVSETTIPGSSAPVAAAPSTTYPSNPSTTSSQTIPGSAASASADRATVMINAKISTRTGTPQAVRNTKFYLLDKDIDSILSDADIEPIEGQTLSNSFAMAIANQGSYGSFYREAMAALKDHIKYAGTTDSSGKAQLGSVKPDSYYLFGVARAGDGFAIWNSPVSVTSGENLMNLAPQPITQMPSATGEE